MTSTTQLKAQPWKTQWPAKNVVSNNIEMVNDGTKGTMHGYQEGETIVMDGNSRGNTMPSPKAIEMMQEKN